jgi:hypothetical protein
VIAFDLPWWVSGLFGLAVIVIGAIISYRQIRRGRRAARRTAVGALPSSVRLVRVEPGPPAESRV